DGSRSALIARAARPFRIARDGHSLDVGQLVIVPSPALRQCLRMGADSLDIGNTAHAAHQAVMNAQFHFAADLERRTEEHVERMIDRALARVFDGHHAEIGDPALDFMKYFVDCGHWQSAYGRSEMLQYGCLRESP